MKITNARLGGRICTVETEGKVISKVSEGFSAGCEIDAHGLSLYPGLIDIHVHGRLGHDVMSGDIEALCAALADCGVTSFLPTTMTASHSELMRVTQASLPHPGAQALGFHLEGPYISPLACGAQDKRHVRTPDISELAQYKNVRMVTLAPEAPGAVDFIRKCGCAVSIGHTRCSYDEAIAAIDAGAVCITHTFNAMPPLLHRAPGPIGAAITKNIYVQLICDGLHVLPPACLALYRIFGADRMILISDSIRPAGLPDGVYESGGLEVHVKDRKITLPDGTLAGCWQSLRECVRTAVRMGIPALDAVKMASETPAKMLGLSKGVIAPSYDADMILADNDFNIRAVIIGGEIYKCEL